MIYCHNTFIFKLLRIKLLLIFAFGSLSGYTQPPDNCVRSSSSAYFLEPSTVFTGLMLKGVEIYPDNPLRLDFILEQGSKMRIEKYKPYPDIIYILTEFNEKLNKDFIFQFSIKGKDTAGKEVLRFNKAGL